MTIDELIWPKERIEHIAEHGVTPDEVDRYYEEHRADFRGASREAVEQEVRAYLRRAKYRDALAEYIASLRARAEVRRLTLPKGTGAARGSSRRAE